MFAVQCETTSGILNPIVEIGALVEKHERRLLIDAMSAFGALPLDAAKTRFDALAAPPTNASRACGSGLRHLSRGVTRRDQGQRHDAGARPARPVADFANTGQYRFTPPIHVIVSFHQALQEFWAEGGQPGRGGRYAENCNVLIEGMRELGFRTLLPDRLQAPIIVTFHMPEDARFVFQSFYDKLKDRGYVIYPGKLTVADSFRIGCIGRLNAHWA